MKKSYYVLGIISHLGMTQMKTFKQKKAADKFAAHLERCGYALTRETWVFNPETGQSTSTNG